VRLPGWWRARPASYSRRVWFLIHALDLLPWPWGEQILAQLFMAMGLARRGLRNPALAWASAQEGRDRWPLAMALCAFRGRWVARAALVGIRSPGQFLRHVVVRGEEHLVSTSGAILLGFHLGPPAADVALRAVGHRLAWLGWGKRVGAGWRRNAWQPFLEPEQHLSAEERRAAWPGLIHRARRIVLDGGKILVMADGAGKEVCRIPLPGEECVIRAGWLALHRHSGAVVLPVLTHLEGRTQVVTIHPPLPMKGTEGADKGPAWQTVLGSLVADHVRRFPEQSYGLAFRTTLRAQALRSSSAPYPAN
jgi:hypothetical protein